MHVIVYVYGLYRNDPEITESIVFKDVWYQEKGISYQ